MNDTLRALAISASILIPVVVFITVISIVTVRRGEASMLGHDLPDEPLYPATATVGGAAAAKAAAVSDEINVAQILGIGLGLFVLSIVLLLALSLLQHM
jgi:hypothetical protein